MGIIRNLLGPSDSRPLSYLLQQHPEPSDRFAWNCTQLGLFCLPLIPIVGGLLLVMSSLRATATHWQTLQYRPINRAFALLSLLLVGVSSLAEYPGEAFVGLVHFLPYFWVLAAQSEITGRSPQLRRIACILAVQAGILVPIGLAELYLGWGSTAKLWGLLPWPLAPGGTPPGRMSSLLTYANNLALYLTLTFSLGLGLWCASWRRWRSRPQKHSSALALWTGLLLLNGLGLLLTQSRSAWGLAALSAFTAACYLRWKFLVAAVLGSLGAVFWAAFGPVGRDPLRQIVPAFFWARLTDQNFPNRPIATLRSTQWQFTLDLIQQRPLQGWGLRNFSPLYEAKTQVWMGHPHNLYLMLGAEIGLPLALFLLAIMGWIFYHAVLKFFSCHDRKYFAHPLNSSSVSLQESTDLWTSRCLSGAFLLALANAILFHGFDVLLFDFRINATLWILVSQILGELYLSTVGNLSLRRSGFPDTPHSKPRLGADSGT